MSQRKGIATSTSAKVRSLSMSWNGCAKLNSSLAVGRACTLCSVGSELRITSFCPTITAATCGL